MAKTTGQKLLLLLWKNFTLQKRNIPQTVLELVCPMFFSVMIIVIRFIYKSTDYPNVTIYPPFLAVDIGFSAVIRGQPTGTFIYYSPNTRECTDLVLQLEQRLQAMLPPNSPPFYFRGFRTEDKLVAAYRNRKNLRVPLGVPVNENPVLAGIVFSGNCRKGSEWKYKLRFPATFHIKPTGQSSSLLPQWYTERRYELFQLPRDRDHVSKDDQRNPFTVLYKQRGGGPGYWKEGFLFLQYMIDSQIARIEAINPGDVDKFEVSLNRFPYPKYTEDRFVVALQVQLPMLIMLSYIYANMAISKAVTHEKERKLKESMKIMGLPSWLHWTAWFIESFIFLLFVSVILLIIYKIPWYGGMALLQHTDPSVFMFLLVCYSFSIITLAFLVSAVCATAHTAATVSGAVFIVTYFHYLFLQPRYKSLTKATKLGISVFSNTGMALLMQMLSACEGTGAGLQWATLARQPSPDENITPIELVAMLLLDGFIYFVLAVYIEAVFPSDYGIPLPWYFPISKRYWRNKCCKVQVTPAEVFNQAQKNPDVFQAEPSGLKPGIQIKGLSKKYRKKIAVQNLWMNFFENQVTALLGHNGAGKTTTMSMLTGMIPPTSGTALINGYDVVTNTTAARYSLGLCPQHDILFDTLTVQEHLKFFCLLKGVPKKLMKAEIDRMLGVIMLENKRNAPSRSLSGGMKRKLSVGIALIGGSKVVLLDEPTSGMDPTARRSTWDIITNEKQGRTIVLSTHFMDEADLLGDRIAIMAEGQVRCCGSSLFLKKKFGGGYHLIISKLPDCKVDQITELIQRRIPEVGVYQNIGAELSYTLPDEKSPLFAEIFEDLERNKEALGIDSYGCSITQMEEVFMRVREEVETPKAKQRKLSVSKPLVEASTNPTVVSPEDTQEPETVTNKIPEALEEPDSDKENDKQNAAFVYTVRNRGCRLYLQQFRAMVFKKLKHIYGNKIFFLSQILVPEVLLVIGILSRKTMPDASNPIPMTVNLQQYYVDHTLLTAFICPTTGSFDFCSQYKRIVESSSAKIVPVPNRNMNNFLLQKSKDNQVEVNFRYIVALSATQSSGVTKVTGWFNNQPYHAAPLSLNLISNAILQHVARSNNRKITIINHPLPYKEGDSLENLIETENEGHMIGFVLTFGLSFTTAGFVVSIIKEQESRAKHLQRICGVKLPIYWLANYIVDFLVFLVCIVCFLITLIAFQTVDYTGKNYFMLGYFVLIMLVFFWGFLPFMYVSSFVFEIPVVGYTKMTLFNLLTGIATFLAISILQLKPLGLKRVADLLEWIFMVFPNFALGYSITLLAANRKIREECPKLLDTLKAAYSNGNSNFDPCSLNFGDMICCDQYKYDFLGFKSPGIGRFAMAMVILGAASIVLLVIIECNVVQVFRNFLERKKHSKRGSIMDSKDDQVDDDVQAEVDRIRSGDMKELFQSENMLLRNLTKYYGKSLAVDHLCLGIKHAECFGLLGINGAGKTTTFKMLTGDLQITEGDAYVGSKSVKKNVAKIQQMVGYCPQFDALIPELTGRETLHMFARLRGIPEKMIKNLANELAAELIFTQHLDKRCGKYSGGNKRKLSTAVALMGHPVVVFLDEPTTGMDPEARRHLWNALIATNRLGTSIILTTHSMEECEALCTRVAIMVNGTFRCLGSLQHLKAKFGDGYTIIAQLQAPSSVDDSQDVGRRRSELELKHSEWQEYLQPLRAFIEESFPVTECELREMHPGYVHYHVTASETSNVKWSQLFEKMEEAKQRFNLEAYSVGQTSLEQIFLAFTKQQK